MKRIVYALLATLSGLVLMFSYRTSLEVVTPSSEPAAASTTTSTSGGTGTSSSGSSSSGSSSSSSSSDSSASGSASGSASDSASGSTTQTSTGLQDGTYTGDSVNTRYGPVQVQLTVSGGQITDVQVVDYPNSNGRDRQINERAIPQLVSETVQAQSGQVHMVSGATYTSTGYATSLQSALDQAQS